MSEFFPKDYDGVPQSSSNYLKLEEGENRIRILGSAIIGYQYWTETTEDGETKRKPVRVKTKEEVPSDYIGNSDNRQNAKYFWAFPIYNYSVSSIQVAEITQKKIMNSLEALVKSGDWGDPTDYDIAIIKTKTGSEARDVEYNVMPKPKKDLDKTVLEAYNKAEIDLKALYKGEDPFAGSQKDQDDVDPDDIPEDLGR